MSHDQDDGFDLDGARVVLPGATSPLPVEDSGLVEARRAALVDVISRAIAEVPAERRRRRLWAMSGRFTLAAAVLLAVGALSTFVAVRLSSGDGGYTTAAREPSTNGLAHVERFDTATDHAASSATVGEASTLVTSSSERLVATLPGSTVVEVAPRSRVILARLPAASQELILDRGVVSVDVPEMHPGAHGSTDPSKRRVRVTTPEAVVEVKGTQFDVTVADAPSGGEVTTVRVKRGRVLVTEGARRTLVGAGETWTSAPLYTGSDDPRAHGSSTSNAPADPSGARAKTNVRKTIRPSASSTDARPASTPGDGQNTARPEGNASTLAEQNRLLEAAVAAERQGNATEASRLLRSLLTRFPDSPHRASALSRLRDLERPSP